MINIHKPSSQSYLNTNPNLNQFQPDPNLYPYPNSLPYINLNPNS